MNEILANVILSIVYGLLGIILLIFGYVVFDKIIKELDFNEEIKKNNIALAIVLAGFMIAIGIIISSVVA